MSRGVVLTGMQQIHSLLWIGHALDIRDPRLLYSNTIEAVIDMAIEEPTASVPRDMIYCRFPICDAAGNDPRGLLLAVQTVVDLLAAKTRTIVACSAGLSRSPTIASFALAKYLSKNPQEIVENLAKDKSLEIHGGLWNDVAAISPQLRKRVE